MAIELRTPTEEDEAGLFELDGRAFGAVWSEALIEAVRPVWDLTRLRIPTTLAAGRRLTATSPETLRRADHFFGHLPLAHCSTGF